MTKKRLAITAYVLVSAFIIVTGVVRFVAGPSEGTVQPPKTVADPVVGVVPVDTAYAHFAYPDNFAARAITPPVAPVVASFAYVKHNNPWSIDIAITRLPTGSLSDDSGYNYRQQTPGRFVRSEEQVGGQPVISFQDRQTTGFNKVAYLHNDHYDASIAIEGVTAADGQALMNQRLQTVLASWRWK